MTLYKVPYTQRLDEFVFALFGSLEHFEQILEANSDLPIILETDMIVKIPLLEVKKIDEKNSRALW